MTLLAFTGGSQTVIDVEPNLVGTVRQKRRTFPHSVFYPFI